MIGMGVFAMVVVGLATMTFSTRAIAEENVYRSTALTLAQAYLEQIRSVDFTRLSNVARGISGSDSLPLISMSGETVTDESSGPLQNNDWAEEVVLLDEDDDGNPRQPMTFRFRPTLVDLGTTLSGNAAGVEITVLFETTYNYGTVRTYTGTLRTVRSDVPTY